MDIKHGYAPSLTRIRVRGFLQVSEFCLPRPWSPYKVDLLRYQPCIPVDQQDLSPSHIGCRAVMITTRLHSEREYQGIL